MDNEVWPDEIRAVTDHFVTETVSYLREVLAFSSPDAGGRNWPRMSLYRVTDAQDTLGMLAGIYAAYLEHRGFDADAVGRYLQTSQQRSRSEAPHKGDREYVAGLMGRPVDDERSGRYVSGKVQRDYMGEGDLHQEWTIASIHAVSAIACDDPAALKALPPGIKAKAKRLYKTMASERDDLALTAATSDAQTATTSCGGLQTDRGTRPRAKHGLQSGVRPLRRHCCLRDRVLSGTSLLQACRLLRVRRSTARS